MSATAVQTERLPLIANLPKWCKRTVLGLVVDAGRELSFEDWATGFDTLDKTRKGHQWHIGDYLVDGEQRFGDECYQVIDPEDEVKMERDQGETYRQYQQVAFRIPTRRRLRELSFSHHQVVAYLDSEDDQDYWLARAVAEDLSVHQLRKMVREGRLEGVEHVPDLIVLADPEVRAWLEADIQRQRELEPSIPPQASFLRNMMHSRIGQAQWQLDRTVESDCNIVREAVKELLGTADEIFMWLQNRNYFMSPPDLDDRLDLLVDERRIKEQEEEGRKEGQRGSMRIVYLPVRNPLDDD